MQSELDAALRLSIAALVGLAVGLEREWSGHASGPDARFAGLRTFLLLGILGGAAGLLIAGGSNAAGAAALGGGMALAVGAYVVAERRGGAQIDGTTEAAALVVVALGALAGGGVLALTAGTGALVVFALSEKSRLHWLVRRVGEDELHAGLQFAVLALVILPLLPSGPIGGSFAIHPRDVWTIVLFFSALNFSGFLARRSVGPRAGYTLTGMLGGLISSTAVTLDFTRRSRQEAALRQSLAYGVAGACTVLFPRVVIIATVLNVEVGIRLIPMFVIPMLFGVGILLRGIRTETAAEGSNDPVVQERNPLRLGVAIQMAVAFQLAMTAIALVQQRWGTIGLYPTAAFLGLTDVDALTMSMSRAGGITPTVAARIIVIGVLVNTLLKLGLVAVLGTGRFRRLGSVSLLILAIGVGVGLLFSTWAPGG